jgi:hypothetical protein
LAQDDDDVLLGFLLNGSRPRFRRERQHGQPQKQYTPVTDPSLLEPYERLFYDENPARPKETVAVCVFFWSEAFSYEQAAAWYGIGATYDDFRTCKALTAAGVSPELAGRPFSRNGYKTGLNVLGAVVSGAITVEQVRGWKDRIEAARRRAGA